MDDRTSGQMYQSARLQIPHFAGKSFHVVEMTGEEAISKPYSFRILFTCPEALDGSTVTGRRACLKLDVGPRPFYAVGVVLEFVSGDPTPTGDFTYEVVIGPRFNLLNLSRQNQVYGGADPITVAEIISGKLSNRLSRSSTSGGETLDIDFELRLSGVYPARFNVVQFDESDLAFISRSCEHHGVFYFFEHGDLRETMVFGDANVAFDNSAPIEGGSQADDGEVLPFRMTRGLADDVSVSSFIAVSKPVPAKMFVRDFDDTQASAQLLASAVVDSSGSGAVVEYGAHFTGLDEGFRLAQIRAEEWQSEKTVFRGASTSPRLRPGYFFTLRDHPSHAANAKYVVTSVRHHSGDARAPSAVYQNTFECVRFDSPYRPKRLTPRPIAAGLFNAVVDSAGLGERADLDGSGRYRIRHMYDESNSPPGRASGYVRKAQPYAGKDDTGFHFPLLKDAEVVVGYINGDPDRPMIIGAVPNSVTPAVSVQSNNFSNRFRTPSGGLFELYDGSHRGPPGASGATGAAGATGATGATGAQGIQGPAGELSSTNTDETDDYPYLRFVSEDPNGTLTGAADYINSSYLRLGGPVSAADETGILAVVPPPSSSSSTSSSTSASVTTALTLTTSTVDYITFSSSQAYLNDSLTGNAAKGTLTTAQLQGNTATANLSKAKVTYKNRTPLNKGLFMYSDGDMQLNIVGGAYMEFQSGHATVVNQGDSYYTVLNGTYSLSAQNGVVIQAGVLPSASETNTDLTYIPDDQTAFNTIQNYATGSDTTTMIDQKVQAQQDAAADGVIEIPYLQRSTPLTTIATATLYIAAGGAGSYATNAGADAGSAAATSAGTNPVVNTPADLYLYASNNINQKAYGPLSEITYGDTYKNVQGNTTDIYCGTYYKETHGVLIQHLYADTHNTYHQNTDTVTLGGTAACFLGAAVSFKFDVELNTILGLKTDLTIGGAVKMVTPFDVAMILGPALKLAYSDYKYTVSMDFKSGAVDFKDVVIDAKNFMYEIKNGTVAASVKGAKTSNSEARAELSALVAKAGTAEAKAKDAVIYV